MKDEMMRWFRYTAEDAKAAQAELDELADQGWELAELGIFIATFRRTEQPRRCWVEPARWMSSRRKDEQARTDHLDLCSQAGWDLLDEASGLFYFQAQPGTHPVPIQTDGSMEWEEVLKKSLWDQAYTFFYLVIYWVAWTAGRYFWDQPRVWELFFSNGAMVAQLLLLVWVESYDCRTGWLASIVCHDLRATEGDEGRLDRYFHRHAPIELTQAELGYDQAWTYHWDDGSGLIFRQGDRVVHIESEVLDLTDRSTVSALLTDLDGAACALLASVIA